MHFLTVTILGLVCALSAYAGETQFSELLKASLIFRDESNIAHRYPHILNVYLRLDNTHDSDISWIANSKEGIEAELLDLAGKPVPQGPQAASIMSNPCAYLLPYGSRLDWLVSHGGISLAGDAKDHYAIMIGGRGWLVPIETINTYSLRIRLRGLPWTSTLRKIDRTQAKVLLDLPLTQIQITK